jgi:hypothetical protein
VKLGETLYSLRARIAARSLLHLESLAAPDSVSPIGCDSLPLYLYSGRRGAVLEVRSPSDRRHSLPIMRTATPTDDTATEDAVRIARLTRFAADALDLADRRADLDLRAGPSFRPRARPPRRWRSRKAPERIPRLGRWDALQVLFDRLISLGGSKVEVES